MESAVWPAAMVWLEVVTQGGPPLPKQKVKSRLIPESGTEAPVGTALLVTVRVPVWAPALVGANSTPAVQLSPGASAVGQVLLTSWKPAVTASARLFRLADIPVLVTVTVVGVLIEFGAVVAKTIAVGATWIAAPAAPVPLSNTVAGVATEAELTVSVPDAAPVTVG
jgi:hypothetical protein